MSAGVHRHRRARPNAACCSHLTVRRTAEHCLYVVPSQRLDDRSKCHMHDTHVMLRVSNGQPICSQLVVYTTLRHCTQPDACLVLLLAVSCTTDGTKVGNNTQPRSDRNSNKQLASVSIATLSLRLVQPYADASATVQQSRMTPIRCYLKDHQKIACVH